MHADQKRIAYLDGLRGLAALGVVLTHLLIVGGGRDGTRFTPFGDRYTWFWPAQFGWVGVELFFLISGYVILLTLERCSGFADFIIRRWLRLFPAMLVATIVAFGFGHTLQPLVGLKDAPLVDVVPGLTFVHPSILHVVTRLDVQSLDHSYWSLYTEATFYVVFGTMFFVAGWRWATVGLVVIHAAVFLARPAIALSPRLHALARAVEPFEWLELQYFGWFAGGVLFAKSRELKSERLFALACGVSIVAAFATKPSPVPTPWSMRLAMLAVVALFAIAQRSSLTQRLLTWRPLLFAGFVSYPLYLLHQSVGLGLVAITLQRFPRLDNALATLPAIAIVLLMAWLIARVIEPPLRNALLRLVCRIPFVRRLRSA